MSAPRELICDSVQVSRGGPVTPGGNDHEQLGCVWWLSCGVRGAGFGQWLPFCFLMLFSCLFPGAHLERKWGPPALLFHVFVPDTYDNKALLMGSLLCSCLLRGWGLSMRLALASEFEQVWSVPPKWW